MRRIKIAVTLLCIIIVYSTASLFILNRENKLLKEKIQAVQNEFEAGNTEQALMYANELNVFWRKYERTVTMIIHDDALNGINISIAKITPFVSNENDELIAEIQSVFHQIDQIYEEEFPSWYNIL